MSEHSPTAAPGEPTPRQSSEDATYDMACAIRGAASFAVLSGAGGVRDSLFDYVRRTANELNEIAQFIERLPDVLAWHHLTGVECDHDAKTDVATCGCALWRSSPQPSAGAAVDAWVHHVIQQAGVSAHPAAPTHQESLQVPAPREPLDNQIAAALHSLNPPSIADPGEEQAR